MIALVKLLIGITLSLASISDASYEPANKYKLQASLKSKTIDSTKVKAYQLLINKCNECHIKRNRRRVFNPKNMNPWADDVYKQVFIKKRMPKGKKIKLTNQEYQQLLSWITSTRNQ